VEARGPEFEPDADLSAVKGRLPIAPLERAIRASGGRITLRQGPKGEPVMAIAIPLAQSQERDDSTAGLSMFQGNARVLLVDHEPVARAMTEAMLTRLGYQVVIASDGPDALSKVQGVPEQFGAVLAEMVLPGMDGVQLLDEIKSIRSEIRCILCSGNVEVIDSNSSAKAPHDGFIAKPFKVRDLGALLSKVLATGASVK
jgi:CheY-like chemotaxis protein